MHADTKAYNAAQAPRDRAICKLLAAEIDRHLPEAENKVWHAHPVWFLDGNPIVGYSKLKDGVRLLFWSGESFKTKGLEKEGGFKSAGARYTALDEVDVKQLAGHRVDRQVADEREGLLPSEIDLDELVAAVGAGQQLLEIGGSDGQLHRFGARPVVDRRDQPSHAELTRRPLSALRADLSR